MSFQNNKITYKASILGNLENLVNEFKDNSYFKVIDFNEEENFILIRHVK